MVGLRRSSTELYLPISLLGSVRNIAGTVKQSIRRTEFDGAILNVLHFADIQWARLNVGPLLAQEGEQCVVDVGRAYPGAGVGRGDCRGPSYTLSRRRGERDLPGKSSVHMFLLVIPGAAPS
jgi:hypothetical protein